MVHQGELTPGGEIPPRMKVNESEQPLRIAVVYGRLPFPMTRGDQRTVSHLLAFLAARGHAVDLYTLNAQGALTSGQTKFLEKACHSVNIFPQSKIASAIGIIRALFSGWPLQVGYFWNSALSRTLCKNIDEGKYDIVYVYYMRSAPSVGRRFAAQRATTLANRRVAGFLAMQLSQTLNLERVLEGCAWYRRPLYAFETRRVRRFEARIWKSFTHTMLIGPKDVQAVETACRNAKEPVIDNWLYGAHGTDVYSFRPSSPDEVIRGRLVFSGNMRYRPNVDGIVWFVNNCWDAVLKAHPDAELYIVGWRPTDEVRALAGKKPRIVVTGGVDDVGKYMRSAEICINPVQAAAGMQNKLVEYLASQRPIVCSPAANEGVMAPDDCVAIAATPNEFVDGVSRYLSNPHEANVMAAHGRKFVEENWTWEAHFLKLEANFMQSLTTAIHSEPAVSKN